MIFNMIGGGSGGLSKFPEFTYTGTYELIDDGITEDKVQNWRIKFLTSGTLTFSKIATAIDAFAVGGGGGGGAEYGGGGGGGYTNTLNGYALEKNTEYTITVGAGGAKTASNMDARTGGTSSLKNSTTTILSADGGKGGYGRGATGDNKQKGGAGGSGGGGGSGSNGEYHGGAGGSDGGSGKKATASGSEETGSGGAGQGTTTREFGESTGALYAGGGGGGGNTFSFVSQASGGSGGGGKGAGRTSSAGIIVATSGATNTGGGGGGGGANQDDISPVKLGAAGGSGIVIIRNHRTA